MGSRSELQTGAIVVLLWLVLSSIPSHSKKKPNLEIVTELKPEDCLKGAEKGDELVIHYTGKFTNGKVFDSSRQREPFTIRLGAGQVILGWEEGLLGMCEGEIRNLKIPPHLAYGDRGVEGAIPGGATLLFSVELMELKKPSMMTWNRDIIKLASCVILVGIILVEVYRRYNKESETLKELKKTKKGHKKKN